MAFGKIPDEVSEADSFDDESDTVFINQGGRLKRILATLLGIGGGGSEGAGSESVGNAPVLLNTLDASNSASLSDTTSFTSTYHRYLIVFDNLLPSSAGATLQLQSISGGVVKTSGYRCAAWAFTDTPADADFSSTTGILMSHTSPNGPGDSGCGMSGELTVINPSANAKCNIFGNWSGTHDESGTFKAVAGESGGFWDAAGVVTGFSIAFSAGNIATGKVKVYGLP